MSDNQKEETENIDRNYFNTLLERKFSFGTKPRSIFNILALVFAFIDKCKYKKKTFTSNTPLQWNLS